MVNACPFADGAHDPATRCRDPSAILRAVNANTQPVYFRDADYAGAGRRVASFVVDMFVIYVLLQLIALIGVQHTPDVKIRYAAAKTPEEKKAIDTEFVKSRPDVEKTRQYLAMAGLALIFTYGSLLRATPFGTLGYMLTGIRLVDVTGRSPGIWRVTKRFIIALLGIIPFGATFFLCLRSPKRQAVHDRLCQTWMVRARAQPAGAAVITHRVQTIGTWVWQYVDVEAPEAAEAANSSRPANSTAGG